MHVEQGAPVATPNLLTPGFKNGGLALLKAEAQQQSQNFDQYDCGVLSNDLPFIQFSAASATVAGVKSEWERMGVWDQFECPHDVSEQKTPDDMRAALERSLREHQEKPQPIVNKGRGRGKAKGPVRKYTEVLMYACNILDTVQRWKKVELDHRIKAFAAKANECTCWWSSSPVVICGVCKQKGKKQDIHHGVTVRKSAQGTCGLRFQGEWVPVLMEIKHGHPAGEMPELERFLEHRLAMVNGQHFAGREALNEIKKAGEEVTLTFYHRYMDYATSLTQSNQQMLSGRSPRVEVGPAPEEVEASQAFRRALVNSEIALASAPGKHRFHPIVESSGYTPSEPAFVRLKRRWQEGRRDKLHLENLCRTLPSAWPALFRLLPESQKKAATETLADAVVPACFSVQDLRQFYPPILSHERTVKLPSQISRAAKLLEVFRNKHGEKLDCFMVVVDEQRHGAPRYYETIHQPIDFHSIMTRINRLLYTDKDQIKEDVDLIWSNCRIYNPEKHWLHKISLELEREFNLSWSKESWKSKEDSQRPPTNVARADAKSPAGKLKNKLSSLPAFSSCFTYVVEEMDDDMYLLTTKPDPQDPQKVDIVVELNVPAFNDQNYRTALYALEKGLDLEKQKVKR
ncbi:Ankyrin repeat [Diplonema papillatum]|nr:Ankyrin repeat [Diplonema papillatum]